MSNYEMCSDNRFEIIRELKKYIIEATNIETSPKEMEVLDNICFRLWQLGLTLETKNKLKSLEKENQELKDTNMKYAKLIDDFQTKNMRLEKVLEIIKSKNVDTFYLAYCFYCGGLERYNRHAQTYHMGTLKKQEYELLKEVLKDEY